MKRTWICVLSLCLLLSCAAPALAVDVDGHRVVLSPQNLRVNGADVDCEKYNIDGSNYFKLRDLARLMNGTASQFSVGWDAASGVISLETGKPYDTPNGTELIVGADKSAEAVPSPQTLRIDGVLRSDLQAWNIGGSNFFKLRDLGTALGFLVDYEAATNTAVANSTDYVPFPVTYERQAYALPSGTVNAHVLTVDTKDPRVMVKSFMVNRKLGATTTFEDIVGVSPSLNPRVKAGVAFAVINANFFEAYQPFQTPIGHFMMEGRFLHAVSGLTSLGIDAEGGLHMGREPVFTRVRDSGGRTWTAYEINSVKGQFEGNTVMYTIAWGSTLTVEHEAWLMTVRDGTVTDYRWAEAGETAAIPAGGYVLYMTRSYTDQAWVYEPTVGAQLTAPEYYLINPTEDSFPLDGIVSMISGSPRLVQGGEICYTLDPGNDDPLRFGPTASSPRTAAGISGDGRLVLVSVDAATIQQMRELMYTLGCVEAVNLDGGASRALYYIDQYLVRPGRNLTTVLEVFVNW